MQKTQTTSEITGTIAKGRGIGCKTITRNISKINEIVKQDCFTGTLNVVLKSPVILENTQTIDGKGKHFVIPGRINGTECLIYRWRGAPFHIIEIIAASPLRKTLNLNDDDAVTIAIDDNFFIPVTGWKKDLWRLFYAGREKGYYNDSIFTLFSKNRILRLIHKHICQKDF